MRDLDLTDEREKRLFRECEVLQEYTKEQVALRIAEENQGSYYDLTTRVIAVDLVWNDAAAAAVPAIDVHVLDVLSLCHEFAHILQHRWCAPAVDNPMQREAEADVFSGFWLKRQMFAENHFPIHELNGKIKFYMRLHEARIAMAEAHREAVPEALDAGQYPSVIERHQLILAGSIQGLINPDHPAQDRFLELQQIARKRLEDGNRNIRQMQDMMRDH